MEFASSSAPPPAHACTLSLSEINKIFFKIKEKSPGGLIKTQALGPTFRVSQSEYLDWNRRMCISKKFPEDADATKSGTTL